MILIEDLVPQPLDFGDEASHSIADFIRCHSNSGALDAILEDRLWLDNRFIIIGPPKSGKHHLADIWAENRGARVVAALDLTKDSIQVAASKTGIAVLNADSAAGQKRQEEILFHMCNAAAGSNGKLLLTASCQPVRWPLVIHDLKSRMIGSETEAIHAPEDRLLGRLLIKLLADKQISVASNVIKYSVPRMERSHEAANALATELDWQALAAGKKITRVTAAKSLESLRRRKKQKAMTAKNSTQSERVNADFLHGGFPTPIALSPEEKSGPRRFYNRELSWLAFNWRVLEEAQNASVPLLERVRFVAISATNLDEFYAVRVAGLLELASSGNQLVAADGLLPSEQLHAIEKETRRLLTAQQTVWESLKLELECEGIHLLNRKDLTNEDHRFLDHLYIDSVFPILTPLAIDPAHPFPFIPNEGFALALRLKSKKDGRTLQALIPIPEKIERFIRLPDGKERSTRFIPLEELLVEKIGFIFPGFSVIDECAFRILRDSDLELEEEAEDLVREFEIALKRRRRGDVIHLSVTRGGKGHLQSLIKDELKISEDAVFALKGMIGLADLNELVLDSRPDLLWPKFLPRVPERVRDYDGDMFRAVRKKDMLLHHPYETFDMVVRFIRQAANDPDVVAIKQTLYRTSYDSPIVEALCEAAENGKSVTALVELKARFDEAANIRQSRRLERAGAHVVYGFLELKTHAKVSTVVRREGDQLVTYTHYGTGNYHPITARIYTDLSLFTCNPAAGRDATKLINFVSGYARPASLEQLAIAPINLRSQLLDCIDNEINLAREGKPGEIWAKMNSLIDPDVIEKLYEASEAGMKITLVIRGICGLRPGIEGLSSNIRVKSVVGRFLEHSRIVCFGNGKPLPSNQARVFISSADWMDRNLNRRVETLVEIKNPTVQEQVVSQIMAANLADQAQSWVLQPDGAFRRHEGLPDEKLFSCHRFFLENPSLSGRGSAGAKDVTKLAHTSS